MVPKKDWNDPTRQFFGAYFHQDWKLEYGNYQAAIDDFVRQAQPQDLAVVLAEIGPYLASDNYEDFDTSKFGGNYCPEGDGLSTRDFLNAIKRSIHRKLGIIDIDRNHAAMQLFGGYFHQDWKLVYDSYLDAIDDFVQLASPQQLDAVLDVISPYLPVGNSEDFDIVNFGGNYHLEADGLSKHDFLTAIKESIDRKRGMSPTGP